jgi:hypothetical protein
MMRHIRTAIGLAVVACALGVGAASATAASFESTGGTTTKGLSVTKNEEFQVWPMTIICPKAVTKGSIAAGKTGTFTTEVKYSSCTTFGDALKVTVSPGNFEYNADGVVTITAPITITPSILKCHYEIPPQAGFATESVLFGDVTDFAANAKKFPNGQEKIQVQSLLKGMHYTAFGWPCTGPKTSEEKKEGKEVEEEGEEGKFSGKIEEEVVGGNLTWFKE